MCTGNYMEQVQSNVRKSVGGVLGGDRSDERTTKITNNYYGKNEVEEGGTDTPAKNKNTLKVDPK